MVKPINRTTYARVAIRTASSVDSGRAPTLLVLPPAGPLIAGLSLGTNGI
ncbi:MAG TPA: hypothetical protein VEL73_01555 [Mycobacteriales bacterium]|nr:hypothetical protein [Mycobacteriales bacterium]